MMNKQNVEDLRPILQSVPTSNFFETSRILLESLGYQSDLNLELSGNINEFLQQFPVLNPGTLSEQNLRLNAISIRLIYQVTNDEINAHYNRTLGLGNSFDMGQTKSFVFFSVELKEASYSRGQYAVFVREINKRLRQPAVVLFRTTSDLFSLAFVHRREHKFDRNRDVLGHVSVIREIDPQNPHRAHMDVLSSLSLQNCLNWIDANGKNRDFDGLLSAWLTVLDTEELNQRFYRDLFSWFERAVEEARFPNDETRTLPTEEHIIRLITRLLFVWFIKEKGLISDELFIEHRVANLLNNYDRDSGDSYYRAVLQNLFFATLNTEKHRRGFSKEKNTTHRDFSLYRYKREIRNTDTLLSLFSQTPFINGGLFDCLDSEAATSRGGWRIDCFSDVHYRKVSVPNRLFFDDNGLIAVLNRYKFTVEENTPVEQEVALDPELLGKVFENLLAAYNPETRDSARKQTGSYYTPRAVVDYMVEESLLVALKEKVHPVDGDMVFWEERLRYLLDYEDAFEDANELFEDSEADNIVRAISELKVLDPAVGSGAFPMGILHKLTLALRRIDPENKRWEALQKERAKTRIDVAFDTQEQQERDTELLDISETFERYSGDFGRKLYLIQNSIFGVDIQPVACQIAKLRFFISLAIEQKVDETDENLGIKPLPNLETRFVSADTLLNIDKPKQLSLGQTSSVNQLLGLLDKNRELHFHATTRAKKLTYRKKDAQFRLQLSTELQKSLSVVAANQIANWDPYDQNTCANWFDAGYMFGVRDGFDLVIGNPPYIQLQKDRGKLGKLYRSSGYGTFASTGDIYQLFYERGCQLLGDSRGVLTYITSNSWLKAEYGKPLRRYFTERHTPLLLLEMGKDVFKNAIVDTNILVLRHGRSDVLGMAVDMDRLSDKSFPPDMSQWSDFSISGEKPWVAMSATERSIMDKMESVGTPLMEWDLRIYRGVLTGYNEAFVINNETKEALIREDPRSSEILKPILRGRDIQRYRAKWAGLWLIDVHNGFSGISAVEIDQYPAIKKHLDLYYPQLLKRQDKGRTPYNLRNCAYHGVFDSEKLFWMHMASQGRFAYSESETIFCNQKVFVVIGNYLKYLVAVLNSQLITWLVKNTAVTTGMGLTQWDKYVVERLPVPNIPHSEQQIFIYHVDEILKTKASDESLSICDHEVEINRLVFELYGLTENEIREIEREGPP